MNRRGFSLVEVVVALLVLTVAGAAAGTLALQSRRIATRIEVEAAMLRRAAEVADSLGMAGSMGSGEEETEWGRIRWGPSAGGGALVAEVPTRISGVYRESLRLELPW